MKYTLGRQKLCLFLFFCFCLFFFFLYKYSVLGWIWDKFPWISFSTEIRQLLPLLFILLNKKRLTRTYKKVESCSKMFIAFLWMTGPSSFAEIHNYSKGISVNLISRVWSDCTLQSSFQSQVMWLSRRVWERVFYTYSYSGVRREEKYCLILYNFSKWLSVGLETCK